MKIKSYFLSSTMDLIFFPEYVYKNNQTKNSTNSASVLFLKQKVTDYYDCRLIFHEKFNVYPACCEQTSWFRCLRQHVAQGQTTCRITSKYRISPKQVIST